MAMADWMELEALGGRIADLEERLATARLTQNHGLAQLLEKEIAAAEILRDRVMSHIAASLTSSSEALPRDLPPPKPSSPPPPFAPAMDQEEGVETVWNQLSRSDIERARRELQTRRSEMLARHAEELKALESEAAEIETLEHAIHALVRKLNIGGAEVVPLERPALSHAG
jgi:hypothetical protein